MANLSLTSSTSALPVNVGQSFRTLQGPTASPALYQLAIVGPDTPSVFAISTYTFPLSPQQLRYTRSSMSNFYDVQGTPQQLGVKRNIDSFGLTPPLILAEGTTGWDYHATDGYIINGLQSMQLLREFLDTYAQLNQSQIAAGNTKLYQLEFYDFFSSEFWVVEPVGPQMYRQSADRTVLTYFRFQWAAVRAVSAPLLGGLDAIGALFGTPAQAAALTAASTAAALLTAYSPVGSLLP
jgi:hypothetical protein